ncbi:MAG: hypothetical protein IMY71_04135 [Bacteroidetes bacterium]|nr:hypothetical protein [Bacteroidota bacterium]
MKNFIKISIFALVYIAAASQGEGNKVPLKKDGQVSTINALNCPGVIGDEFNDDTKGIQSLLDAGASAIYLPKSPKYYKLTNTLRLHSGQTIIADQNAVIKLAERACKHLLTNADLLALNADDAGIFEMSRGPITDIHVDGIWSNKGYRAIRLLSCGSPIEKVKISNIFGSYKFNVIAFTNYNAHPGEEGSFSDISIERVFCSKSITGLEKSSQIWIEGPCYISNITIRDYHRIEGLVMSDEISIEAGVVIDNILITNAKLVYKCSGSINFLNNHGKINNLTMNNIFFKYQHGDIVNRLINNKGSISFLNQWNISEDFQIH